MAEHVAHDAEHDDGGDDGRDDEDRGRIDAGTGLGPPERPSPPVATVSDRRTGPGGVAELLAAHAQPGAPGRGAFDDWRVHVDDAHGAAAVARGDVQRVEALVVVTDRPDLVTLAPPHGSRDRRPEPDEEDDNDGDPGEHRIYST